MNVNDERVWSDGWMRQRAQLGNSHCQTPFERQETGGSGRRAACFTSAHSAGRRTWSGQPYRGLVRSSRLVTTQPLLATPVCVCESLAFITTPVLDWLVSPDCRGSLGLRSGPCTSSRIFPGALASRRHSMQGSWRCTSADPPILRGHFRLEHYMQVK